MIFHDREDLLHGEEGGYEAVSRRGERQGSREGKPLSMSPVCSAHLCSL